MRFQRSSNGSTIALDESDLLGAGGEARIYALPGQPEWVAKIWHKPTLERSRKLEVMLANPPADPMAAHHHAAIAWPVDLLHPHGRPQSLVGFLMPRVQNMRPIGEFASPKLRRHRCPLFNSFYLHRTARNLAIAVRALHERGYVIGDLNESNVLVADTALVTLVDTDSFQVWDAQAAAMYRCRVGKLEYTPPELQGKSFAQVDREPAHDAFGLAVLVYQLLLEGTHPFAGVYRGHGDPPPLEHRIAHGHFPSASDPRVPYNLPPTAPPFEILYPGLRALFIRAFQDGHFRPGLRPDPQTWQLVIEEAESHLVRCWANDQHIYGDHLERCPWCLRTELLAGRDPFPSIDAVRRGAHRAPPPRGAAPAPTKRRRTRPPIPPTLTQPPAPSGPLPTPPPIPSSSSSARVGRRGRRPRPLLGEWNDWAWISFTLTLLGGAAAFGVSGPPGRLIAFLTSIFALLTGILGEGKAHSRDLDGRGKWLARIGIVAGLAGLAWCLSAAV